MNPQDVLNQQIRLLIGDLQVNLMIANARIQELEAQLSTDDRRAPKPNGKQKEGSAPLPS